MVSPRIIAYYLPQFHPIKENDEWWGEGFTEWFNVGKAKPLFWGHRQPKIPTNLGYYDLRVETVREKQAEFAKEAGIEGFCYWHYWFYEGKLLLEKPMENMLKSGKPDYPFCIGWANHSWEKKTWVDGSDNEMLIEQKYGGEEDYIAHFEYVLPFFKDSRYITVNNKPLFLIYSPQDFDDVEHFIELWNRLSKDEGFEGIHFVAQALGADLDYKKYILEGFDGVASNGAGRLGSIKYAARHSILKTIKYSICKLLRVPRIVNFRDVVKDMCDERDKESNIYPQIICGWDHTPRSGRRGVALVNFTMELFYKHIVNVCDVVREKKEEERIIFLKSWNEWGEGNFMEPDIEYGMSKIETMKKALDDIRDGTVHL